MPTQGYYATSNMITISTATTTTNGYPLNYWIDASTWRVTPPAPFRQLQYSPDDWGITPRQLGLAAQRAAEREYAATEARAEAFLRAVLSPSQRRCLRRSRCFYVQGSDGRRYRVRRGQVMNVEAVRPGGRATHRYCAHPVDGVPDADAMAAQKLHLETDAPGFRRVANAERLLR